MYVCVYVSLAGPEEGTLGKRGDDLRISNYSQTSFFILKCLFIFELQLNCLQTWPEFTETAMGTQ